MKQCTCLHTDYHGNLILRNGKPQMYRFAGGYASFDADTIDGYAFDLRPIPLDRFYAIDPLAEKYYSISPYAYCAGDPVNLVDPTSLHPVYNWTTGTYVDSETNEEVSWDQVKSYVSTGSYDSSQGGNQSNEGNSSDNNGSESVSIESTDQNRNELVWGILGDLSTLCTGLSVECDNTNKGIWVKISQRDLAKYYGINIKGGGDNFSMKIPYKSFSKSLGCFGNCLNIPVTFDAIKKCKNAESRDQKVSSWIDLTANGLSYFGVVGTVLGIDVIFYGNGIHKAASGISTYEMRLNQQNTQPGEIHNILMNGGNLWGLPL